MSDVDLYDGIKHMRGDDLTEDEQRLIAADPEVIAANEAITRATREAHDLRERAARVEIDAMRGALSARWAAVERVHAARVGG